MKELLFIIALAFANVSLAKSPDLTNEIDSLYQTGKITEGEYSVLKHLTDLEKRKVKIRTRAEILHEQMAKIEKLRRDNRIDEGEYSVLVEIYKNTAKALGE